MNVSNLDKQEAEVQSRQFFKQDKSDLQILNGKQGRSTFAEH